MNAAGVRVGRRAAAFVLGIAVVGGSVLVGSAGSADAHPLGNTTVNHYDGLHFYTDRVTDRVIEDAAEIPTLQRRPAIDVDGSGAVGAAEAAAYATRQCQGRAAATVLVVDGSRAPFAVVRASYLEKPGAIKLMSGRLECDLSAPADLGRDARVGFETRWDPAGIGWREVTAVATGVTLNASPFPASSISSELTRYPNDLLSAPLDVGSGEILTSPGDGTSTYAAVANLPGADAFSRALNTVTSVFEDQVGADRLTVGAVGLAVVLAMVLGAGHALLPGHGKTIMAAYLVGRRGRVRDVVAVGATVTVTHTASVLVLGLLISVTGAFAPTQAEQVLAVVSGLIVVAVGLGLLASTVRGRRASVRAESVEDPVRVLALAGTAAAPHSHPHAHPHPHAHDRPHDHSDSAASGHSHGVFGSHSHEPPTFGRRGLIGLGVAGGLVPSPSALLVLLAAVALGRGAFGVVLVLAYGFGMAATLTAAGILLVRLRERLAGAAIADRFSRAARVVGVLPYLSAGLVLVVGIVLTLRATSGAL